MLYIFYNNIKKDINVGRCKGVELLYVFKISCYQLKIDCYMYYLMGAIKQNPIVDTQNVKRRESLQKIIKSLRGGGGKGIIKQKAINKVAILSLYLPMIAVNVNEFSMPSQKT